ncbi:MAG: hydrogenase maturation nickel metallochaperone HypA [Alphaproteobacteria bacterium]|uniref:Hydrogenase maturation factor HypA n=1 Tax=Candidatus Nitrobium versatile TaxID=2884831 RepID=A0A953J295_9BACT|nr:hydrogenase maturation nickel metallochaperone HypA [Candidatus Nitrobium versatile]
MHELSITTSMLDIVKEHMTRHGAEKLRSLKIKVGEMAAVEPQSLLFCFEACTKDTPLEGAVLDIEVIPLTGRCRECGTEMRIDGYSAQCPKCRSVSVEHLSGHELAIVSMEVE